MSDLSIQLHWHRTTPDLKPGAYSAQHVVQYNNSADVLVDAAPDWGGDPASTNPEQALAAALSSCHMMTFLALAAKAGWPVARASAASGSSAARLAGNRFVNPQGPLMLSSSGGPARSDVGS
jgi:organic hydroperoxide reductase OsmC/OhrA